MILDSISNNNKNIHTLKIFRFFLYGWVLVFYNTLGLNVDFFWGNNNFIPKITSQIIFGDSLFNLFKFTFISSHPISLIFILDIAILYNFLKKENRLCPLIIYFLILTLDARAYYVLDGGNNLMELLLIYNIFFRFTDDHVGPLSKFDSSMSNLSLLMAKIQICIVYFVAGHMKLIGNYWPNGTALYYTLSVSEISLVTARDTVKHINPIFLVLGAYSLLAYQLSFPWLVWFKQTRKYILRVGFVFHLGIAFIMGLTFFGYAVCIAYFVFYDEDESKEFLHRFIDVKKKFAIFRARKNRWRQFIRS